MDQNMDMPETKEQLKMDWSITLQFLYGFLTLLGICILFFIAKSIYQFYKRRAKLNDEIVENSTTTESNSVSNVSPVSERQLESNASESDRLNLQLDKLKKLLNRLNAMGTFSRDTIGDLSGPSVSNINRSRAASSDRSEFWSSIDFDEFEDSAINDGNFQRTLTDNSISVSDFSLDTSGMHFKHLSHNNLPVYSNEYLRKVPPSRTNPSEAIAQILTILDSIMVKNRFDAQESEKNKVPIDINTSKSVIVNNLIQSAHSEKLNLPQKRSIVSSSSVLLDKTISSTNESMCSETLITSPESNKIEGLSNKTKVINDVQAAKLKSLDRISQVIEPKIKVSSSVSMEAKIPKGMSVVNIASSTKSKDLPINRLSISSKSIDARKHSLLSSVAICMDPNACEATKAITIPKSTVPSRVYNSKKNEISKNTSLTGFSKKHPCSLEELYRTHSLSNLLVKKLPLQSIQPCFIKSCNDIMEYEENYPTLKTNSEIATENSELYKGSRKNTPRNVEVQDAKTENCKTLNTNSFSSKSLHSPIVSKGSSMLSISESDMKHSPFLGSFSSNLTPSNSEAFLSPIVTEIMSSGGSTDWKSPTEQTSIASLSQNRTPHIENAIPPRNSRIWCTPPSPK